MIALPAPNPIPTARKRLWSARRQLQTGAPKTCYYALESIHLREGLVGYHLMPALQYEVMLGIGKHLVRHRQD